MVRVVWLSANRFGHELLKEAVDLPNIHIVGVITLSDLAKTVMYDGVPLHEWYSFNIPVYDIEDIDKELDLLKSLKPDFIVMCGWRQILTTQFLIPYRDKIISFHPSLLPEGRGPAPIINTIKQGIKNTGLTMYCVSEHIDGGDIIGQEKITLEEKDDSGILYEKQIEAGKKLLWKYLPLLSEGKLPTKKQDSEKATHFDKPKLKDNEIDLENESIEEIYRKIKALSKPYKGAYIEKDGKKLIIWRAELVDE